MDTNKKSFNHKFETAYDVFQFLLATIDDNIKKGGRAYAFVNHLVSPLFASKKDIKVIKNIEKKARVFYVCKSDSPFDQILAQFYQEFSSEVKLGIDSLGFDIDKNKDVYVIDSLVVTVKLPKDHVKDIDNLYFDTKSILSFNMMNYFKNFADKKMDFEVEVVKNEDKAKKLRKIFESVFD
ncbi:MAG: hypothetical protein ACOC1P_02765 [Minisyncoccales bacterium]